MATEPCRDAPCSPSAAAGWLRSGRRLFGATGLGGLALLGLLGAAGDGLADRYDVAVIIGNRSYGDAIPDVDYAHNDADAVRRMAVALLGYPERNIIDLRDATIGDLIDTFGSESAHEGRLFFWTRPGQSRVLVYYSGHGVPGPEDRRGYLLPVDANPDRPELTGYALDTLYANLAKLPARAVTVFIDACFSGNSQGGTLFSNRSPFGIEIAQPQATAGLAVLTASGPGELAHWDPEARHGLFTAYLLRAVYGAADRAPWGNADGAVTLGETAQFLADEMRYCARRQYLREQTPSLTGDGHRILASFDGPPPALPLTDGLCFVPPTPADSGGATARAQAGQDPGTDPALAPASADPAPEAATEATADDRLALVTTPPAVRPPRAPAPPAPSPEQIEAALALTPADWRAAQRALNLLGHAAGVPDGIPGTNTRAALERWQRATDRRPPGYGYLTEAGYEALRAALAEEQAVWADAEARLGLSAEQRRKAQAALNRLGYGAGPADGVFGAGTRAALRRFQRDQGLEQTGYLSRTLALALRDAYRAAERRRQAAAQPAPERQDIGAPPVRTNAAAAVPRETTAPPTPAAIAPAPTFDGTWSGRSRSFRFKLEVRDDRYRAAVFFTRPTELEDGVIRCKSNMDFSGTLEADGTIPTEIQILSRGRSFRLSGQLPSVRIDWNDACDRREETARLRRGDD